MDNRFLQWLVGGLFLIFVAAVIVGFTQGQQISGLTITSCTTLIGVIIGALTLKKNGDDKKDNDTKGDR